MGSRGGKDMKPAQLSYAQLRKILGIGLANGTIRGKLDDLLSGKLSGLSELEILELIQESEADVEMVRILSGQNPEELDAMEAMEYIAAFFGYIRANSARFNSWLGSLGLKLEKEPATRRKNLK